MPPAAPSVARSLGGRERARLGQRRRRPGTSMNPRRALPRPLSLCLCLCLAAVAARGAAQSGKFGFPPRVTSASRPDPAKSRCDPDPGSPPSAGGAPFSLLRRRPLSGAQEARGSAARSEGGADG